MKSVTYTIARPDSGAVLPQAVVTVYQADGTTRASLFNAGGVAIGNPLTADSNGAVSFAAANGTYLLSATSADGAMTLPNISVQVFDLDALSTAIAAGSLAGVIGVKFATQALRNADLAHADGTIALTYADSDPLKNDLSYKIGSSGSGSWSAPLGLMAGLSYNYAQLAGQYANADTDANISGAPSGSRGAKYWAGKAEESAGSINLSGILATASSLPVLTTLSSSQEIIVLDDGVGKRTTLQVLKKFLGLVPVPVLAGPRLGVMTDSRGDNGMVSQSSGVDSGRTTGVPQASRAQSIPDAILRALGHPMEIVGQWTLGGNKSSQNYHDHAMAVMFSRNIHGIFQLDSTNDGIDYVPSIPPGLGPIARDSIDPALARFLPRVGDREPITPGVADQGTTFGNIVKLWMTANDPVANGLGRSVPVIFCPIPTAQPSRRALNRLAYEFGIAADDSGLFPNLIMLRNVYPSMLTDPDMINGPVEDEVVRSDLKGDGTQGADGEALFLHPTEPECAWMGQAGATDPAMVASVSGLPSLFKVATGSNDADFVNDNPSILVGDGSGVLGYSGSQSPAPTGTVAQGWQLGHSVSNGSIGVVASFSGGNQVVTITRTGGSSATTARAVELRSDSWTVTPEIGHTYTINAEIDVPARPALDLFTVETFIEVTAPGMVDDRGQDISSGQYGTIMSNAPNPFSPGARTLRLRGVPIEFTPAMVASITGTVTMRVRSHILFRDNLNTDANGALAITFKQGAVEEKVLSIAHVVPPAVPAAGPACTAAPQITGSFLVGSTVNLVDGIFASGSVTARRLIRNGASHSFTGSTYTFTDADEGKYFYFENTATNGGTTTAMSTMVGPIARPSAELVALIDALEGEENNGIFDFTDAAIVGGVYTVNDLSGNGNPALQVFETRHPGISETLGAVLDGSNDCMGFTWQTAAPALLTVVMTIIKDDADAAGRLLSSDGTTYSAGFYNNGSMTALNGTWTVDGVSVTTGDGLHDALAGGIEKTVVVSGLDTSLWSELFFSRSSAGLQGSIRRASVIAENTADLAGAVTKAVTWVEAS